LAPPNTLQQPKPAAGGNNDDANKGIPSATTTVVVGGRTESLTNYYRFIAQVRIKQTIFQTNKKVGM
jgi:hypothetical protein